MGGITGTLLAWNGASWNLATQPAVGQIVGLFGLTQPGNTSVWALVNPGVLSPTNQLLVSSTGASWSATTSPPPSATYMKLWGTSASSLWAVGWNSQIVEWTGNSWTAYTSPVVSNFSAVWGSGPKDVWVVGGGGTVLHYSGPSGFSPWVKVNVPTTANLLDVYGTSPSNVWVVGEAGTILHFDGVRWLAEPSGSTEALWGVWAGY